MPPDVLHRLQRIVWIWTHLLCVVLLSGTGGYVWGATGLWDLILLTVLWAGNLVALGLWLHRGA